MTAGEWASVLKLSTMWDFRETRKSAIKELSKDGMMDLTTKVALARQYKISVWLLEGYEALIKRKEAISMGEAEQLGLTTVVRLFHIREVSVARRYPRTMDPWSNNQFDHEDRGPFDRSDCVCMEEIQKEFVEELREVGDDLDSTEVAIFQCD
jgi:hypothetical protein